MCTSQMRHFWWYALSSLRSLSQPSTWQLGPLAEAACLPVKPETASSACAVLCPSLVVGEVHASAPEPRWLAAGDAAQIIQHDERSWCRFGQHDSLTLEPHSIACIGGHRLPTLHCLTGSDVLPLLALGSPTRGSSSADGVLWEHREGLTVPVPVCKAPGCHITYEEPHVSDQNT